MESETPAAEATIAETPAHGDAIADTLAPQTNTVTFADLGLGEKLLSALTASGYTTPTPIQEQAIPPALAGRDVLGIAQTGTGKTAAFSLPMIERLSKGRARAGMPRSLILAPTRELADQVAEQVRKYASLHKLKMVLLIGGVSFGDQEKGLQAGADIIIATPGRLLDLFERGKVRLFGIEVMVVDEADRMLDMGFIPDVERIFKLTPFTRQTLFFSATMAKELQYLVDQFLQAPVRVEATKPATAATTITQSLVRVRDKAPSAKRAALRHAIDTCDVKNAIVFCNRKRDVDVVARSLQRHEYSAAAIHGDLPQSERMATLRRFRDGDLRLLVASDVAARGLDIPDVSHVFNYDPPNSPDDYVHRIGRTGRAGKKGASITIAGPEDSKRLAAVESMLGGPIPPLDGAAKSPAKSHAKSEPHAAEPAEAAEPVDADAAETGAADEARAERPANGRKRRRGGRGRNRAKSDQAQSDQVSADHADDETGEADAEQARTAPSKPVQSRPSQPKPAQTKPAAPVLDDEDADSDDFEAPIPSEDLVRSAASRPRGGGAIGFGDHVPAFVTRSVKERLVADESAFEDSAA